MTDPKTLHIVDKLIVPDYDSITRSQLTQPAASDYRVLYLDL